MTETIGRYVSAWNEKNDEAVRAALTACCVPDVIYTDENTPTYNDEKATFLKGIEPLTALVMGSHEKVPGRTFSLLTKLQYFDGHCHYSWGLHIPGKDDAAGWDYIQYNEDNLIVKIVGFLPQQP